MSTEVTPQLSHSLLPSTQQHPELLVVATCTPAHLHLSSLSPQFCCAGRYPHPSHSSPLPFPLPFLDLFLPTPSLDSNQPPELSLAVLTIHLHTDTAEEMP